MRSCHWNLLAKTVCALRSFFNFAQPHERSTSLSEETPPTSCLPGRSYNIGYWSDLFPDLKLAEHRPVRPRHEDNGAGGAGGEDHVHSTFENMSGTSLELLKGEAYIIQVTPSANTVQPTLHWLPILVWPLNIKKIKIYLFCSRY
jgi:hypothetical protein